MTACLIAVGSNAGDREAHVESAVQAVEWLPRTSLIRRSSLIETVPIGSPTELFLNGCLAIETALQPAALVGELLEIESRGGRIRNRVASGNRSIDLDLLLFGERLVVEPAVTVPHPRMSFRRFVLRPATEIAPSMHHPVCRLSVADLLDCLDMRENVIGIRPPAPLIGASFREKMREVLTSASPGPSWQIKEIDDTTDLGERGGSLKLLIEADRPSAAQREISLPQYTGPRWQTGLVYPDDFLARLPELVAQAVASMVCLSNG